MEETVNLSQSGMIMAKNSMSIVEGFSFDDEDLLKEAQKEAEGVRYMKARVDLQYPDRVLQIYQRMVAQNMFQTQVGYAYLRELQDYLYTMPQVSNDEVPPIPVHTTVKVADASGTTEALREENRKSRRAFHWSVVINCFAAAVIVIMFAIAMSSSSPTVLNYENKLQDKYAVWEQELKEREAAVSEKERMLYGDDD